MYKSQRLFDEFVDVERNMNTGKIDHSPNFHKDVLDAVCGATFNASKNAQRYAFDYGEDLENTLNVSSNTGEVQKEQVTLDFEQEMQNLFSGIPTQETMSTSDKAKQLDFGFGPAVPMDTQYISQGIMIW